MTGRSIWMILLVLAVGCSDAGNDEPFGRVQGFIPPPATRNGHTTEDLEMMKAARERRNDAIARIEALGGRYKSHTETISLANSEVDDERLECITGVEFVRVLSLSNTAVTDAGLVHVAKLPAVTRLTLSRTQITNEGLKILVNMPELRSIDLSETKISDEAVDSISQMSGLTSIFFSKGTLSEGAMEELQKALPGCEIVEI